MKEKDFYKIIEKNTPKVKERKKKAWLKLSQKMGFTEKNKKFSFKESHFLTPIFLGIFALFIIISVSISLVFSNAFKGGSNQIDGDKIVYDYYTVISNNLLSDYMRENCLPFFYGWDELNYTKNYDLDTDELVFFSEFLHSKNTEQEMNIYVVMPNIKIDFLERCFDACIVTDGEINGIKARYLTGENSLINFEYNGYNYYLSLLKITQDTDSALDILNELLFLI